MRKLLILSVCAILAAAAGCQKKRAPSAGSGAAGESRVMPGRERQVVVDETISAGRYTYLKVNEGTTELWLATAQRGIRKGETLRFDNWLEMTNFESKELNRSFDTIYFIQDFKNRMESGHGGMGMPGHGSPMTSPDRGSKTSSMKKDIKVERAEGGITVGELLAKPAEYSGKTVKIRGQVVKFSPEIMGKNWVHLQDGTGDKKGFDLTLTTDEVVSVGEVVVFEGTITLDKDLGSGYKFPVLMEEAKHVKK
ncbi:MAG: hypothetical protein ACYTFG_04485 [Planctomycetota bacterium]|jgi:hypothetical protein